MKKLGRSINRMNSIEAYDHCSGCGNFCIPSCICGLCDVFDLFTSHSSQDYTDAFNPGTVTVTHQSTYRK